MLAALVAMFFRLGKQHTGPQFENPSVGGCAAVAADLITINPEVLSKHALTICMPRENICSMTSTQNPGLVIRCAQDPDDDGRTALWLAARHARPLKAASCNNVFDRSFFCGDLGATVIKSAASAGFPEGFSSCNPVSLKTLSGRLC